MIAKTVYTIEQYDALCAAIAQGVLSTKYGDKEVVFRSLNDMIRIKGLMETSLGLKLHGRTTKYIQHSKGML